MKVKDIFPLLILLAAVLSGCAERLEPYPHPPQGYAELMDAYRAGHRWTAVSRGGQMLMVLESIS